MNRETKTDQELLNTVRSQNGLITRVFEVYKSGSAIDIPQLAAMASKMNCAAMEISSRHRGNAPKPLSQ